MAPPGARMSWDSQSQLYHVAQANARILTEVGRRVDAQSGYDIQPRMISLINDMGNTSAATIPIAMNYSENMSNRNQFLWCCFGAGLRRVALILE